jgi:hypothetical protein
MAKGWTDERRAKQAAAIQRWRPWEKSTGPRSADGKTHSSRNAWKGGKRPKSRAIQRAIAEIFAELDRMVLAKDLGNRSAWPSTIRRRARSRSRRARRLGK